VAKEQENRKKQAHKIEWAVGFSEDKFSTTLEAIDTNIVPPSHAMLFWYGTLQESRRALASGITATDALGGGVVLTLHRPNELDLDDEAVFPSDLREAILVVSVRSRLPRHNLYDDHIVSKPPFTPNLRIVFTGPANHAIQSIFSSY
jgi:hypothetical protein